MYIKQVSKQVSIHCSSHMVELVKVCPIHLRLTATIKYIEDILYSPEIFRAHYFWKFRKSQEFFENIFTKIVLATYIHSYVYGAIEVSGKESVSVWTAYKSCTYVSCFSSAGQSFPHEWIPHFLYLNVVTHTTDTNKSILASYICLKRIMAVTI